MSRSKIIFIEIIRYLFLFLFLYTAYAKFIEHDRFETVLSKSPFIGKNFAPAVSWFVPISEIIISIMLIMPKTRPIALYPSVGLMVIFTIYLSAMLLSGKKHPCLCGGVITELSWRQHIVFNLVFIGLGLVALRMDQIQEKFKRTGYSHGNTSATLNFE